MPENLEITKKLKERLKDYDLVEYVGEFEGRPVYRVSDIPLIDYFTSYQGGPDFVWVDLDDFSKSLMIQWNDPEFSHFHDIALQWHPEIKKLLHMD